MMVWEVTWSCSSTRMISLSQLHFNNIKNLLLAHASSDILFGTGCYCGLDAAGISRERSGDREFKCQKLNCSWKPEPTCRQVNLGGMCRGGGGLLMDSGSVCLNTY